MRIAIDSLPSKYDNFKDVFENKNVDHLPEHRRYVYLIDLQDGEQIVTNGWNEAKY